MNAPKNKIDCGARVSKKNEELLARLKRSDPELKIVTLGIPRRGYWSQQPDSVYRAILDAFDAIANNTVLEILTIDGAHDLLFEDAEDFIKRALNLNTSLKDIRIDTFGDPRFALDIALSSSSLKAATICVCADGRYYVPSIDTIHAFAQVLRVDTKLHSLTMEGFNINAARGTALAAAFYENRTIQSLTMRKKALRSGAGAVSFCEALPKRHSLEVINFDENGIEDDFAMRIVRTLCSTPVKTLSLVDNAISRRGCTRIVDTLKKRRHGFTKLELFPPSEKSSPWQKEIRLDIDMLTWENQLQVEKDTWVDRFLNQEHRTPEMLFLAIERAKRVDSERFSHTPNMFFYLAKEIFFLTRFRSPLKNFSRRALFLLLVIFH
jgi:hypothetical protein